MDRRLLKALTGHSLTLTAFLLVAGTTSISTFAQLPDNIIRAYKVVGSHTELRLSGRLWREQEGDQVKNFFEEKKTTPHTSEAYDSKRKMWILIPHGGGTVMFRHDGQDWQRLYDVYIPTVYRLQGTSRVFWKAYDSTWYEIDLQTLKPLGNFTDQVLHAHKKAGYLALNDWKRKRSVRLPEREGMMQVLVPGDANQPERWVDECRASIGGSEIPAAQLVAPPMPQSPTKGQTISQPTEGWQFDWSDVSGASEYELLVMGAGAANPLVNVTVTSSLHTYLRQDGYVDDHKLLGWTWKVRAKVGGNWGPWSEPSTFNVRSRNELSMSAVEGTYRRLPVQNNYHQGRIARDGSGWRWINDAGVGWQLHPQLSNKKLLTGADNPYYQSGFREFELIVQNGRVTGFRFQNEVYSRQ